MNTEQYLKMRGMFEVTIFLVASFFIALGLDISLNLTGLGVMLYASIICALFSFNIINTFEEIKKARGEK